MENIENKIALMEETEEIYDRIQELTKEYEANNLRLAEMEKAEFTEEELAKMDKMWADKGLTDKWEAGVRGKIENGEI